MRLFLHAVVVVIVMVGASFAAEPNYVKTTEIGAGISNSGSFTDKISISFSDGLGKIIQSKINNSAILTDYNSSVPMNTNFLTTCTYFNAVLKPEIVTKPFTSFGTEYKPGNFSEINELLKTEYSSFPKTAGDPYAYAETKYYNDPFVRVSEVSIPGINNNIVSGNTVRSWKFGVGLESKSVTVTDGSFTWTVTFEGGLITSALTKPCLDALYLNLLGDPTVFSDPSFLLSVTHDVGGKYSQQLNNIAGNVIEVAARKSPTDNLIVSRKKFDILGNLVEEVPPVVANAPLASTTYQYNALGQMVRKVSPDGNIETFDYNLNGLLVKKSTKKLNNNGNEIIVSEIGYSYDMFDRLLTTFDAQTNFVYITNYYDGLDELRFRAKEFRISDNYLVQLTNLRGKLVATVSHSGIASKPVNVVDLYSYDDDGNINSNVKIVPGVPVQKIIYTYDIQGKLLSEVMTVGNSSTDKRYVYDDLGRLKKIVHYPDVKTLVEYTYNTLGQVSRKSFAGSINTDYAYTINDKTWLISTDQAGKKFEQKINFSPDGNIYNDTTSFAGFAGAPTGSVVKQYTYDLINRLTQVQANDVKYNGSYVYDDIGRFTSKVEGTSGMDGFSSNTAYEYYSTTNQVKKTKSTSSGNDYLYDIYGNLVVDKLKKMVIEYDLRNMPVRFNFYSEIPSSIQNEKSAANVDKGIFTITGYSVEKNISSELASFMNSECSKGAIRLLSTVAMYYDASGNRVLKIESEI